MKKELIKQFTTIFSTEGNYETYFAPGRVNLIGEHTDYNGGHVFPCALTIGTYAVARKNSEQVFRFYSKNFQELGIITSPIENLTYTKETDWANYPKAVIWALQEKGFSFDSGMDIYYYGNIPNQSGLSSSASIEVLTCYILRDVFQLNISMVDVSLICQYAENQFIQVNCGIMDQFAIAMGRKDSAIFLDTSTLEYEYAPMQLPNAKIIISSSNKKRGLGDSKYNQRRGECEEALQDIQKVKSIQALGELSLDEFQEVQSAIQSDTSRKRAKHAVSENQRTIQAVAALKENRLKEFGELMNASHVSLRDDYEVTGIELDTLVEAAWKQPGVMGSRMTGAGFGGCTVSIVTNECVEPFIQKVGEIYKEKIGYSADFYVVEVGNGPHKLL